MDIFHFLRNFQLYFYDLNHFRHHHYYLIKYFFRQIVVVLVEVEKEKVRIDFVVVHQIELIVE